MHEEKELDHFLSTRLKEEAQAFPERLALLEARVLERLQPGPKPSAPSVLRARWGLVATAGALACILIGIAIGYTLMPTKVALASHKCGPVFDNNIAQCEFFVVDEKAKSIELVASFTGWAPVALTQIQPGVWHGTFSVHGQSQRFAFLINGQNWQIYRGCLKTFEFMGRQECVLNL
jgi:hypothetical protein